MKRIIQIILALLVLVGLFFSFQVFRERYRNLKSSSEKKESNKVVENASENVKEIQETDPEEKKEEVGVEITSADCDNECARFKEGLELDYCEQICGISDLYEKPYESEEGEPTDCEKRAGLEKDYCFKDLAIQEEDFEICEKVVNAEIKKVCKNRITEDMMENQEE